MNVTCAFVARSALARAVGCCLLSRASSPAPARLRDTCRYSTVRAALGVWAEAPAPIDAVCTRLRDEAVMRAVGDNVTVLVVVLTA